VTIVSSAASVEAGGEPAGFGLRAAIAGAAHRQHDRARHDADDGEDDEHLDEGEAGFACFFSFVIPDLFRDPPCGWTGGPMG
jgi:hypothetical protein